MKSRHDWQHRFFNSDSPFLTIAFGGMLSFQLIVDVVRILTTSVERGEPQPILELRAMRHRHAKVTVS